MRDGQRHAAACSAPSHMECPTFRRLVRAAASGVIGARARLPSTTKALRASEGDVAASADGIAVDESYVTVD
jgi:hypothetical protein